MCKILLSINPQHVQSIFEGKKEYEFRKIQCKEEVDKIIIYATYPVMKVVAEVDVEEIYLKQIQHMVRYMLSQVMVLV